MQRKLKKLWKEAFGDEDAFISCFFETAFSPDRCRYLLEGEQAAAMLYWLDGAYRGQRQAYVYAVATAEEYRGRGLCRRLMEQTHEALKSEGYAAAMLYPAEEGLRELYRKMGYRDFGRELKFSCEAHGNTEIREVSPEEYGEIRRNLLPEDGVIQEGKCLEFLVNCAKLYAGPDFLMAANVEGETLNAVEFLGNSEAVPGIVNALGCKEGTFRQGVEAMILPLQEDAELPGYLGLVFD